MAGQGKLLKKIRKKQAQFRANEPDMASVSFLDALPEDHNAESVAYHLFVGNGGTRNGVSREIVTALLDGVESLYMPRSKDFSFASVTGRSKAMYLLDHCNGMNVQESCKRQNLDHLLGSSLVQGPPLHLYLSLIDHIPMCVFESNIFSRQTLPLGLILIPEFISPTEERGLLDYFSSPHDNCDRYVTSHSQLCSSVQNKLNLLPEESSEILTGSLLEPHCLTQSTCSSHRPPVSTALKHRTVSHYGYEFLYGSNTVDPDCPLTGGLPSICAPLISRMVEQRLLEWLPDQLTVNEYAPGAGIPPHVDTHSPFEDGIASLSLGSQVVMDFKHPAGRKVPVFLPRRSLLVMTGESRYLWTHGITQRRVDEVDCNSLAGSETASLDLSQSSLDLSQHPDSSTVIARGRRVSLTFRKVKHSPCSCRFPSMCDSQNQR